MENNNYILIEHFCQHNQVELSFINSLHDYGLIEFVEIDQHKYLVNEQLKEIEKMIDFHYTLNINIEGIEVISNLLNQIYNLQNELLKANNKLKLYETDY
jgi:MerR HTH family regulatory protein